MQSSPQVCSPQWHNPSLRCAPFRCTPLRDTTIPFRCAPFRCPPLRNAILPLRCAPPSYVFPSAPTLPTGVLLSSGAAPLRDAHLAPQVRSPLLSCAPLSGTTLLSGVLPPQVRSFPQGPSPQRRAPPLTSPPRPPFPSGACAARRRGRGLTFERRRRRAGNMAGTRALLRHCPLLLPQDRHGTAYDGFVTAQVPRPGRRLARGPYSEADGRCFPPCRGSLPAVPRLALRREALPTLPGFLAEPPGV